MLPYLGFALVVFAAVFACVVFCQLVLAELLELVSHCLLQAHWQGVAETLETDKQCKEWTDLTELMRPGFTGQQTLTKTYCAVDPHDFQPI